MQTVFDKNKAIDFIKCCKKKENGSYSSYIGGEGNLYATCYALMTFHYLGKQVPDSEESIYYILNQQEDNNGYFIDHGLKNWTPSQESIHDKNHILMHLACAVLPALELYKCKPKYKLKFAHNFLDIQYLEDWLNHRDWSDAWLEGNNLLFVGQLLIYLRDIEGEEKAPKALSVYFEWLDNEVDPKTGLWGTNGYCSDMSAVYGGYHQLLVYYYENHPLPNVRGLVDTVLNLQHSDGGFNPHGNGGACEDVDSVDILVNCYKREDYRRPEIRHALRRCLKHILTTQNPDGGFPYNRNKPQNHMGVPGTFAGPNESCTFPTWFRIHTLALIAEVLPNAPNLKGISFCFNKVLSMGWHRSPSNWELISDDLTINEWIVAVKSRVRNIRYLIKRFESLGRRVARKLRRKDCSKHG